MFTPRKALLASAIMVFANMGYAQSADVSATTSGAPTAQGSVVAPPVTSGTGGSASASGATSGASSSAGITAAQSDDPLIQRREARKQAKDEYKARKQDAREQYKEDRREAKQDYRADKQRANQELREATQSGGAAPGTSVSGSGSVR